MGSCFGGGFISIGAGLDFSQNYSTVSTEFGDDSNPRTLQTINSPLFELLEGYLCRWRGFVEAQSVGIVLLFECWSCELLLFVIQSGSPLEIDLMKILSNHFGLVGRLDYHAGVGPQKASGVSLGNNFD